jgi:hypothetical protein
MAEQEITSFKPVMPLATPEKAWAAFEAMKARLLVDDDYQAIAGKRYIKRSGFRKIAVFFGLSDRILEQERIDREDKSFIWRITVEVQAPNGRISAGVGICDSSERNFAHVEHDVYATAHTRAKSRAISDMVAGGAVSAEEMEANHEEKPTKVSSREIGASEALERAGIDPELVEIRLENGTVNVYPTRGLVDWAAAKIALAVAGFTWKEDKQRWSKK